MPLPIVDLFNLSDDPLIADQTIDPTGPDLFDRSGRAALGPTGAPWLEHARRVSGNPHGGPQRHGGLDGRPREHQPARGHPPGSLAGPRAVCPHSGAHRAARATIAHDQAAPHR